MGCLNELKICEISRNPKSNRCWKFQLSILTNKKKLSLKKYELSQEWTGFNIKTTNFVYRPNFWVKIYCLINNDFNLCNKFNSLKTSSVFSQNLRNKNCHNVIYSMQLILAMIPQKLSKYQQVCIQYNKLSMS